MTTVSRRTFLVASIGALSAPASMANAAVPAQCNAPGLPAAVVPNRLFVDCATQRNFKLFRANPDYVELTGIVSVNFVQGKLGRYNAGSMMLFPRLKPSGVALGAGRAWPAFVCTGDNQMQSADAIRVTTLPGDDYFCRYVLRAPWDNFIGFSVDVPFEGYRARGAWLSNVDRLADGIGVGITWASASLNAPWFAGSRWIPGHEHCQGKAWRAAIIDGLNQAAVAAC